MMNEKAKPLLPHFMRGEGIDAEQALSEHKADVQKQRRMEAAAQKQRRMEAEAARRREDPEEAAQPSRPQKLRRPWVVRPAADSDTASKPSTWAGPPDADTSEYAWDIYHGKRY